jgi:hypothetical protein
MDIKCFPKRLIWISQSDVLRKKYRKAELTEEASMDAETHWRENLL